MVVVGVSCPPTIDLRLLHERQLDGKRRAVAHAFTVSGDGAFVHLHKHPADGKARPKPLNLAKRRFA